MTNGLAAVAQPMCTVPRAPCSASRSSRRMVCSCASSALARLGRTVARGRGRQAVTAAVKQAHAQLASSLRSMPSGGWFMCNRVAAADTLPRS